MKRWIWAATACLIGASAANAEYVIIRVLLNKGPSTGGGISGGPGFPGAQVAWVA